MNRDFLVVFDGERMNLPIPESAPNPDPRCPKCGFTMCELFDERQVTPLASVVTPNGRYQCYRCTPVKQRVAVDEKPLNVIADGALRRYARRRRHGIP